MGDMIVVKPTTFAHVDYEPDLLIRLVGEAVERVSMPADTKVHVEVDENLSTNRVRVVEIDPVKLEIESGAVENYQAPRTVGELEAAIAFTRLLLEVGDRRSVDFGAPEIGEEPTRAHRMAWDINLFGRTSRLGLRIHQPRYLYNFRNRHGFSDVADQTFNTLWNTDGLRWTEMQTMSDNALDGVVRD